MTEQSVKTGPGVEVDVMEEEFTHNGSSSCPVAVSFDDIAKRNQKSTSELERSVFGKAREAIESERLKDLEDLHLE